MVGIPIMVGGEAGCSSACLSGGTRNGRPIHSVWLKPGRNQSLSGGHGGEAEPPTELAAAVPWPGQRKNQHGDKFMRHLS